MAAALTFAPVAAVPPSFRNRPAFSRFGKFVSLQFDDAGFVLGALVANYLLEKSRIVHQVPGERSFHMFYQLCAGAMAEEREALALPGQAPRLDTEDRRRMALEASGAQAALRWAEDGGSHRATSPPATGHALPSRVRRRSNPVPDGFGLGGKSDLDASEALWGGGVAGTGPQLRAQLAAASPGSLAFQCLQQGGRVEVDGVDDAMELVLTRRAMMAVGIDAAEQALILRVVAAVLHLSEVRFHAEAGEDCAVTQESALRLRHVCALLRVGREEVRAACTQCRGDPQCDTVPRRPTQLAHALTTRRITNPDGGCYFSPLNGARAADARDALTKALYERLFSWLVRRVNAATAHPLASHFIGVLDIYGFEDVEQNGFEQLLINFANEKLQRLFNEHVLDHEAAAYRREGISLDVAGTASNHACLELLEQPKMGILSMADEECIISNVRPLPAAPPAPPPPSSPNALPCLVPGHGPGLVPQAPAPARRALAHGALWPRYRVSRARGRRLCDPTLCRCRHVRGDAGARGSAIPAVARAYTRPPRYSTLGFVDKNKDALYPALVEVLSESRCPLVSAMFAVSRADDLPPIVARTARGAPMVAASGRQWGEEGRRRNLVGATAAAAPGAESSRGRGRGWSNQAMLKVTASRRFRSSLATLIQAVEATQTHFVRCINSNPDQRPASFDAPTVLRQLRYSGVLEALRVRRAGFPTHMPYRAFLQEVAPILPIPTRRVCGGACAVHRARAPHSPPPLHPPLASAATAPGAGCGRLVGLAGRGGFLSRQRPWKPLGVA